MAMKIVPWLVLLIALNLLLEVIPVYSGQIASWITFVLVAIIGIVLVTDKK